MAGKDSLLHTIDDNNPLPAEEKAEVVPIAKPSTFSLEKFKSKRAATVANVETLQTGLPHHNIAQAKDFVRLHPDEETYWSPELCFVNVPIKGQKRDTLHLIDEDLAMRYLPAEESCASAWRSRPSRTTCSSSVISRRATTTTIQRKQLARLASRPRRCGCKPPAGKRKVSRPTRSTRPRSRRLP